MNCDEGETLIILATIGIRFAHEFAQSERFCGICSFEGCLNIRSSDDVCSGAALTIIKAESIIEVVVPNFIRQLLEDRF